MTLFAQKALRVTVACTSSLVLLLAGCGIQTGAPVSQPANAAIRGIAMGGSFPIIGATVNLWATQSAGYPTSSTTGSPLATAMTNSAGNFSFDPVGSPYTCPTGQYAYLTVTGGHTGTLASNNQSVLMAAIGSCSNFSSAAADANISIYVSEVSTVAAAYALSNFMYVGGVAGSQAVYVSAPANNNAATPACTGSGFAMSCTAAGLGHAFANAANLANVASFMAGVPPTGMAYSVPPSNINASVPQALINTIANVLEYCVNSTGGLSTDSGGGGHCGTLFTDTTPPGGSAPTNTLQAVLNMAKYPTNNVSTIYGLVSQTGSFVPTLASAPTDLSMAIVYSGTVAAGSPVAFGYPTFVDLDSADNVYVVAADAATPTMSGISGLSSSGATLFSASTNSSTSYKAPGQAATDNLGHIWLADVDATGTLRGINTVDGTSYTNISTTANTSPVTPALGASNQIGPVGLSVDRANNLWFGRKNGTSVFEITYTAGAPANYAQSNLQSGAPVGMGTESVGNTQITFDTNQNAWVIAYNATTVTGYIGLIPNQTISTNATYIAAATAPQTKRVSSTSLTSPVGTAFNSSGISFTPITTGVVSGTPVYTSNIVSSLTTGTPITGLTITPGYPATDGAGSLLFTNEAASGPLYYVAGITASAGTFVTLVPCYLSAAATTCASTSPVTAAQALQVDSTGSTWVVSGPNGALTQLIGTAAPTWPALSYGHPGVLPQ